MQSNEKQREQQESCISRRTFLFRSGLITVSTLLIPTLPGITQAFEAEIARYPKRFVTNLSTLEPYSPFYFNYPDEGKNSNSMLVKLGTPAGGGLSRERDVVAFNMLCPHMGGPLQGTYQATSQVAGPCPFHQSIYDLTRHGMVISGHGTESLPQVLLELEGDDIYAVGLLGLIYGRYDNLESMGWHYG